MNKGELVKELAKKEKLTISKTEGIVSSLLEIITKALSKGEEAVFIGFGTFRVKKRSAKNGRNPQTGALSGAEYWKSVRSVLRRGRLEQFS